MKWNSKKQRTHPVVGRDRERGYVLLGGLGSGGGMMWCRDDEAWLKNEPGYDTAPEIANTECTIAPDAEGRMTYYIHTNGAGVAA